MDYEPDSVLLVYRLDHTGEVDNAVLSKLAGYSVTKWKRAPVLEGIRDQVQLKDKEYNKCVYFAPAQHIQTVIFDIPLSPTMTIHKQVKGEGTTGASWVKRRATAKAKPLCLRRAIATLLLGLIQSIKDRVGFLEA